MVIVTAFALLALFSIISIVLSAEDPERPSELRDNRYLWTVLGRR